MRAPNSGVDVISQLCRSTSIPLKIPSLCEAISLNTPVLDKPCVESDNFLATGRHGDGLDSRFERWPIVGDPPASVPFDKLPTKAEISHGGVSTRELSTIPYARSRLG